MNRTITALYSSRTEADRAVQELHAIGVTNAHVVDQGSSAATTGSTSSVHESQGIWHDIKSFFSDDDRSTYEEGVRRGRSLLTVQTDDDQADRVVDLLDRTEALDVDEEQESYRAGGWDAGDSSTTARTERLDTADLGEERIPIIEEQLAVGKRDTVRGGTRIRSYVTETPVSEQVRLREEHVSVERVPVNETVDNASALFQDRTIEVSEHAEEAVVGKRAVVTEELRIRKDVDERVETVTDSVRRTEVDIDNLSDDRLERSTDRR